MPAARTPSLIRSGPRGGALPRRRAGPFGLGTGAYLRLDGKEAMTARLQRMKQAVVSVGGKRLVLGSPVKHTPFQNFGFRHWRSGRFIPGAHFLEAGMQAAVRTIRGGLKAAIMGDGSVDSLFDLAGRNSLAAAQAKARVRTGAMRKGLRYRTYGTRG